MASCSNRNVCCKRRLFCVVSTTRVSSENPPNRPGDQFCTGFTHISTLCRFLCGNRCKETSFLGMVFDDETSREQETSSEETNENVRPVYASSPFHEWRARRAIFHNRSRFAQKHSEERTATETNWDYVRPYPLNTGAGCKNAKI